MKIDSTLPLPEARTQNPTAIVAALALAVEAERIAHSYVEAKQAGYAAIAQLSHGDQVTYWRMVQELKLTDPLNVVGEA